MQNDGEPPLHSSHSTSEAIRVATELVGLLVRGLDDDVHSAIDVIKVITKMAYSAKKRQMSAIYKSETAVTSARSRGQDSARTLPGDNSAAPHFEAEDDQEQEDDDDDGYGVSSAVSVNEQDWGHAGLYHNVLQGVILRASKFAAASHHDAVNPSSLTTPSRHAAALADAEEDPRTSARSLVDLVEHTAQMFLAMSVAFHPMVAKLIVELCFEYISNAESIASAHPWLFMLLGPIVVGLPTEVEAWDARLIDLAVARHPKVLGSSAAVRLLRNPAALVQELRFALARFLATYVASERMLEGLSTPQAPQAATADSGGVNGSSMGSPPVAAPVSEGGAVGGTSPLLTLVRTPPAGGPTATDSVRVERLSLLALGREAERAAADRRRDRSPDNNNGNSKKPQIAPLGPGAVSPLSQNALELHNLHTAHNRGGGSITPGGILVPRLDIPRIFKNRGGTNENAGGVFDASPVRPPHHQLNTHYTLVDGHTHHHQQTAFSGGSPSILKRQSIDFLGPHVGDSLMRQYGIADHMKLRWKQQQQQVSKGRQQHPQHRHRQQDQQQQHDDRNGNGGPSWTGGEHSHDIATEDPFHVQQLVVCGHKLGQLFGTVDAKMLLRLKKDHEALVAAHELEASSSAYYTATSTAAPSLGMSQVLSASIVHRDGLAATNGGAATLGNSVALRLSLGRVSVGRDDFQLPAAFDEWSRNGLASWVTFGIDRIGSAFVPLPREGDSITTTATPVRGLDGAASDAAISSGAYAAKLIFRELAMIVLQGLAGHDTTNPGTLLSRMVSSVGSPFTPHRTHAASLDRSHSVAVVVANESMLLPASLAQQQQQSVSHINSITNNPPVSGALSGRRGSYASSSVDGPATVVGSVSRAALLDGGSMVRAPPSAIVAGSVSPTRSCHRDEVSVGVDISPPTAAETEVPAPPAVYAVQLIHGGRCGLALLRSLRFEAMKGIATPLLLGCQLMDGLESRNVVFLEDLAKSIAAFALDGEAVLFSIYREPTSLVGYPTMSGPASDKVPKDAFLELWVSVVTSLLEISNPIPYDAIAWSLASLCYILKHLPSSCAYVIQTAVVCANVIHDVLELLRQHVSFHFSFACCVHYALELFDIFLGIQKPSEMLIAVFVSLFASSPATNPINAFLKMYVRRVATAEDAWALFHEEDVDQHRHKKSEAAGGPHATPSGASHLSTPGGDEHLVAGASLLQRRLSSSTLQRGPHGSPQAAGVHSGEDVADTMFWPSAFHVERHRVRLLQHYRVVSRFLSSRHHGSYLSIAHETQGEHPLEFLLNPVEGISLVILSDVAPQSWLSMQMETLKLIEEVACQPAMVSPLLQQSGWIATYTRFLFLAFLEAYHSQAFSSGDAYVMSFSKGVLRALSALCQQDGVARAWALKLGIVRTLIQEIDLEQSVNDIRERQLKKSRDSQSAAVNGARQQLLSRLASMSTGSASDGDEDDATSVLLAETRGDFLNSPTSLKGMGKPTTMESVPPVMLPLSLTSPKGGSPSMPTRQHTRPPVAQPQPSTTEGDEHSLPQPLMTQVMNSPSVNSLSHHPHANEFWSEQSTDTIDTRHVSEIMGSPISMMAYHTNDSSIMDSSSAPFPPAVKPKI
jgi:hypothetical protein